MAASLTVQQVSSSLNSPDRLPLVPRRGVLTLFGYGISVRVDRGHLIIEDGIGTPRRQARFARVGHDLRRLVIISCDGTISLAALRWLAAQGVAMAMLDRDGEVLVTTGPVRPSDSRLRRAQALAHHTGIAVPIMRRLIDQKLAGQGRVARDLLQNTTVDDEIQHAREALHTVETPDAIRFVESRAALAYWSAWHDVPVRFPRADLQRVPDHWRTFGARRSPLTDSPRLAINPPNAILNYLYAILEAEARLAAATLGLDPGLGILHVDTDARDSLACDLMEAVRPDVDAFVLRWLLREPLDRRWFFELPNGNARLMGSFAMRLGETAATWSRAVGPVTEWVAATLRSGLRSRNQRTLTQSTLLTQQRRREAKGRSAPLPVAPNPPRVCAGCGVELLRAGHTRFCVVCARDVARDAMTEQAKGGRLVSHTPDAEAKRGAANRRHRAAQRDWDASGQSGWTNRTYDEQIQPRLLSITTPTLVSILGFSYAYASAIRKGRRRPHPRHWFTLAQLVGLSSAGDLVQPQV